VEISGGRVRVWVPTSTGEDSLLLEVEHPTQMDLDSLIRLALAGKPLPTPEPVSERHGDQETGDIVRMGEDVVVERGEVVEGDVVALGGSILVRGRVMGDVVALGGSVRLDSTAVVNGDAVAMGGKVELRPGARLMGQRVSMGVPGVSVFPSRGRWSWGTPQATGNGMKGFLGVFSTLFGLGFYLVYFLLGWLFYALGKRRLGVVRATVEERFLPSLGLGIVGWPLAILVGILLAITVIGIPVAMLLPALLFFLCFMGTVTVLWAVGEALLGKVGKKGARFEASLAVGLLALLVVVWGTRIYAWSGAPGGWLVTYLRWSVYLVIWSVGLGAALLSLAGSRPPKRGAKPLGESPETEPTPPQETPTTS
jgi:hypothetical protein